MREMTRVLSLVLVSLSVWCNPLCADPCGMVPPIYVPASETGIVRDGLQQTYAFYRNGIETLVIHPGFKGKVDEFGMLIPFPTPPAIRKVSDELFTHLKAAIDPPEVILDLRPTELGYGGGMYGGMMGGGMAGMGGGYGGEGDLEIARDETRVLKEEAVGMYDVAVLQAGSSAALSRWMQENAYRFPDGMDQVCEEYIQDKWCFVAVRARIGHKRLVDPQPGQREVDSTLQPNASFDGHVQAMGFRFRVDRLTIPMRLSTYNEGDLHNIVYVLAEQPVAIKGIEEELVVRQIAGQDLLSNVTGPLPLRVLGGEISDIPKIQREVLIGQRANRQPMQAAIDLFRGDLRCAINDRLSNREEELEKDFIVISERLGLRGAAIDALHREVTIDREAAASEAIIEELKAMTLTVIDGEFPRELLSKENLTCVNYQMPSRLNSPSHYHAVERGPLTLPKDSGIRHEGKLSSAHVPESRSESRSENRIEEVPRRRYTMVATSLVVALLGFVVVMKFGNTSGDGWRSHNAKFWLGICLSLLGVGSTAWAQNGSSTGEMQRIRLTGVPNPQTTSLSKLIANLGDPKLAEESAGRIVQIDSPAAIAKLSAAASQGSMTQRGWAIVCLGEIGSQPAMQQLRKLKEAEAPRLVKTWISAAQINAAQGLDELVAIASNAAGDDALERPFRTKLTQLLESSSDLSATESMIALTVSKPAYQPILASAILDADARALARVTFQGSSADVRRTAASYLATKGERGDNTVAAAIIEVLQFTIESADVPWADGPLFLPQLAWKEQQARDVFVELTQWQLWAERNERPMIRQQLMVSLRDLAAVANLRADASRGESCLTAVAPHLDVSRVVTIAQSHGFSVDRAILDFVANDTEPGRAYLYQEGRTSKRREQRGGMGFGGMGSGVSGRESVELVWLVRQAETKSQIAQFGSGGLTVRVVPSAIVYAIKDPERIESLASMGGRYRGLLHKVNAPSDLANYRMLHEYGLFSSSEGYREYPELETGYWVYVYPTWYIWKEKVQ